MVLHFNLSTAQNRVGESCLGGNYATNSTYEANLSILLSSMANNSTSPDNTRFFTSTVRSNSDGIYGLFQCRLDFSSQDCNKCAKTATEEVTIRCPFRKESVIYYFECWLHYSDKPFISTMQVDPTLYVYNPNNISDPDQFSPKRNELMEGLVARAVSNSSTLFAVGENYFTSSKNIFGLAQCTQDISRTDCGKCLNTSVFELPTCCEGGRVIKPSCNIRFELFNFFGPEAIIPAPAPPPPPRIIAPPNTNTTNDVDERSTIESLQFNFGTVRVATEDFCDSNKLGEGGFGPVYKEIAVKRLSRNSGQGVEEFKNEVLLLAKLQHRSLVKLLDLIKRSYLDWERRYKIIGGIARGLLYLHEDSRDRIIHRDLKASNILLDAQMNPKISDFGIARLFVVDQTQGITGRIVGTYGYMAPEYALHGQFSVKSDVFSFGVLVLEIVSGQKNNSFYGSESAEYLLSYAWRQWVEGTALELIEPTLRERYSRNEVMRCIHIGLLCVQKEIARRPTMASVVLMLNSYSVTLPSPAVPAWTTEEHGPNRNNSSQSVLPQSINEASITELYPR
ncbi:hypothetical protein IFM89_020430 [Coptis chinensis]|uniref:Cysteine-rich receptor-like protein kinase 10 n=1 Tax=Coptis chinensis TaxID=261450 RepID=A0A835HL95_9MAGN|nr:hypothetical protein IFM89_020430 [Coptis chinensis]